MTRVKFCGFTRPDDVEFACSLGVTTIGIVREPSSKRFVPDALVRDLVRAAGPFSQTVSVYRTVRSFEPEGTTMVQASDFSLWRLASWFPRIQVIHIDAQDCHENEVMDQCSQFTKDEGEWSGLLLDAMVAGVGGGTGVTIPWDVAAQIVEASKLPVVLAGGLRPDNVAGAIQAVRPYGVDVCTGIESSPGIKDPIKMRDFLQAVNYSSPGT